MNLQTQIQKKVDSLSAAEKRLAQYILNDNTAAAVLTTTGELARAVGISESTVVRFAQGFKGFLEMKRAVQKDLRTHLRAASRMEETIANIDKHGANPDEDVIALLLLRNSKNNPHGSGSEKSLNGERRIRRKT
jgi:DNA-binding MurR/RpiR family transcriptional regulator